MASSLPQRGLIAIAWATTGFAGIFVAARAMVRWYKFERFATDDYWIYFAWTMLCVNALLITLQVPSLYYMNYALTGAGPEEELLAEGGEYVRYEFVSIGIFWTVVGTPTLFSRYDDHIWRVDGSTGLFTF